jgi:hypothetical protein
MSIRGNISNAVTLFDTKRLQGGRPTIAADKKILVAEPQFAAHDRFTRGINPAGASREFEGA